jgi:hypothetical protein
MRLEPESVVGTAYDPKASLVDKNKCRTSWQMVMWPSLCRPPLRGPAIGGNWTKVSRAESVLRQRHLRNFVTRITRLKS